MNFGPNTIALCKHVGIRASSPVEEIEKAMNAQLDCAEARIQIGKLDQAAFNVTAAAALAALLDLNPGSRYGCDTVAEHAEALANVAMQALRLLDLRARRSPTGGSFEPIGA